MGITYTGSGNYKVDGVDVSPFSLGGLLFPSQFANAYNEYQSEVTRNFNAAEAEKQRLWNERMWSMSNEYNSPSAQMQRLREAGLNPNMVYGQPISESSPASGGAEASASPVTASSMSSPIASVLSVLSDIALKRSQARLNDERAETESYMRQARYDNLQTATLAKLQEIEASKANVQRLLKLNELTDADIANIRFDQTMREKMYDISLQQLKNDTNLSDAQCEKLLADRDEALARARVTNRQFDEMIYTYSIRYLGLEKQVELSDAQIEQAKATARQLGLKADMFEPDALISSEHAKNIKGEYGDVGRIAGLTVYTIYQSISRLSSLLNVAGTATKTAAKFVK